MKVFMICGKARAGKDTMGDLIYSKLEKNHKICKLQIAQYLKYYVMKYFGWDGEESTKPRDLLTHLGTDIIRKKINPDFHINRLIEDIEILSYFYDTFIVTDVRFPVEIEKVKEKFDDVVLIKINREESELTNEQKLNITETALDNYTDFDYVVDNNKSLDELEQNTLSILKKEGVIWKVQKI